MKAFKKLISAGLVAAMSLSLVACGGSSTGAGAAGNDAAVDAGAAGGDSTGAVSANGFSRKDSDGNRVIYLGTWWVQHYDSADESLEASPDYVANIDKEGDDEAKLEQNALNREICQMKWDNVAKLESKYTAKFYWQNLTYTGVQESINTSILAGTPDADIYLVDAPMAIPAQLNGLAVDLRTVLPEDADVFTDQNVMSFCDLGDGKVCILQRVEAQHLVENTYPLGFNVQMLEDNNLEDPRDLWARGEWTWDKFVEYAQVLTQDTDGDGQIDQYGFCGFSKDVFEQLVMSNGANVANGNTQTLDSAPVGEALQFLSDLYNVYNVCYPYDFEGSPWESMRKQYRQGNVGMFPIACWINADGYDYDQTHVGNPVLPFDIAYVRWPVGPSGNQETNAGKNEIPAEAYIIPVGIEDPETVYNFLYDLWNWAGDVETTATYRDDKRAMNWWYESTSNKADLQDSNFNVMADCGAHTTFDLWQTVYDGYDFNGLLRGEVTPAQFQETYKQPLQDGIDAYFN